MHACACLKIKASATAISVLYHACARTEHQDTPADVEPTLTKGHDVYGTEVHPHPPTHTHTYTQPAQSLRGQLRPPLAIANPRPAAHRTDVFAAASLAEAAAIPNLLPAGAVGGAAGSAAGWVPAAAALAEAAAIANLLGPTRVGALMTLLGETPELVLLGDAFGGPALAAAVSVAARDARLTPAP